MAGTLPLHVPTTCSYPSLLRQTEARRSNTDHFEPKPVIIVQCFHFHCRNQAAGESVAEYAAELRRLVAHCKFEDYLQGESVQRWLLTEPELTLAKASELAQGMETAARDTQVNESS